MAAVGRTSILAVLALFVFSALAPRPAQSATWERDGHAGRDVRALALTGDADSLVALVGGARDPSQLWMRDEGDWAQPTAATPGFVLALAPMPEGGLLLGTGRDIADQPGVFWFGGSPPAARRLYDAQAIGALTVAPSPTGPGSDVYAATAPWADRDAPSSLLRRDAASGAWTTIHQGTLSCYEAASYFKQVVIPIGSPDTLLAVEWCLTAGARQAQVWRSDDRGHTWQVLPRRGAPDAVIGALAVDPLDAEVLYLSELRSHGAPPVGLDRSFDGGQTWTTLGQSVAGLANIRALVVDPRDPRRLLAGADQGGAFVSHDRGESWQPLPGLEGIRIWSLLLDEPASRLYAATTDGVWRMPLP